MSNCLQKGFLILALLLVVNAKLGYDISVWEGEVNCFECTKQAGYDFVVIEIYSSAKQFNNYLAQNIKSAYNASLEVDLYIFPDTTRDPAEQINSYFQCLIANQTMSLFNNVWLDIENENLFFANCTQNIEFLQAMINTTKNYINQNRIGLYTSQHYWPIMCNTTAFSDLQLWYPRWDNQTNFNDFTPFGGFANPVMKQFYNDVQICCTNTDVDWKPDTQTHYFINFSNGAFLKK
ncbi:hypothetical protein ABPG72_017888 [Tetrahymena utriculariae]